MHIRSMLLGSLALAGMAFAADGVGSAGGLAPQLQSYDPTGPNYISPDIAKLLADPSSVISIAPAKPLDPTDPNIISELLDRLNALSGVVAKLPTVADYENLIDKLGAAVDEKIASIPVTGADGEPVFAQLTAQEFAALQPDDKQKYMDSVNTFNTSLAEYRATHLTRADIAKLRTAVLV